MIAGNQGLPQRLKGFEESHSSDLTPDSDTATLPPFEVLLKWLTYYHAQTGTWPEPGTIPATNSLTAVSTKPTHPAEKPLLKVLPGKSTRTMTTVQPATENPSSYYNLKSSPYYQAALEIAEKHVFSAVPLNDATILTLASVIAWCHYSPFVKQYSSDRFNARLGMYRPLGEWSKELKMRKATLSTTIKELEKSGIVQVEEGAGNSAKRVYRLVVSLPRDLPVYEPFQPELDGNREPQNPSAEPEITRFRPAGTTNEPGTVDMSHVKNNKFFKTIKNQNHEHGLSVEPGTAEEKFFFLVEHASFPGYISPDGLTTLDKREAQKFASAPVLDLVAIKKIYHQVLAVWSAGKCQKTPIGFFHTSLTRYLNQFSAESASSGSDKFKNMVPNSPFNGSHAGTTTAKPVGSFTANVSEFNSRKANSRFSKMSYPENSSSKSVSSNSVELEEITNWQEDYVNLENSSKTVVAEVDKKLIEESLQNSVLEALQNRFKNPFLVDTLAQLQWQISFPGDKLQLELRNSGSGILAVSALSQSNLSLLRIALSQSLRTLAGKSLEIEILLD